MSRWPPSTALVTGASSGIGRSMARLLAEGGTARLVLVARTAGRLEELGADLASAQGTEIEVLPADLGDPEGCRHVEKRLAEAAAPPVELLVNNAGFGTRGRFWELPVEGEEEEIRVNVLAPVRLTRAALPGMVERGSGAILNVSSMAALQPAPLSATYGSTKAYLLSFSEALNEELRGTGVTVTALLPGFTRTEFQDRLGVEGEPEVPGFMWLDADGVAEAGLRAAARGSAVCIPGLGYRALATVSDVAPRSVVRWVVGRASGRLLSSE